MILGLEDDVSFQAFQFSFRLLHLLFKVWLMVLSVYLVYFVLDFFLNLLLVELGLQGLVLNTPRRLEQRHRR